ncbi:MAG: DciA family protein [Vampirovibrionia bacterium]
MSRKKYKTTLKSLENLLPSVAKRMGIESRMKEMIIMNYWSEIAKGELGKDSKAYSIITTKKGLVLNIATKSAMVAQELSLIKMELLDKINILALQVGLKISDMSISTKYWENSTTSISENSLFTEKNVLSESEIDQITLTSSQIKEINELVESLQISEEEKKTLKKIQIRDLKLKKYREIKGFPSCKNCGVLLNNVNYEYCPVCRFQ